MVGKLVLALSLFVLSQPGTSSVAHAETHEIKMMNKHPDNKKERNVFVPAVIKIKPGDTVRFVVGSKGHNTETIKDMFPEGGKTWKSDLSKEFELTLDKPGIYGFRCTPHYILGMVGVIIVEGDGWNANLETAKAKKHHGRIAKKRFTAIWEEVDRLTK